MGRCRPCSNFPCKNPSFIGAIVSLFLVCIIYNYECIFRQNNVGVVFYITMFFFLMSMWSYFTAAFTNPGPVPTYWGMYSEHMQGQRKYCLICHNFKPQRTHHCSKCKQCILNMDHHCPWINNCVGFDNRKYFLLFVTYLLVAMWIALVVLILVLFKDFGLLFSGKGTNIFHFIVKLLLLIFFVVIVATLSYFSFTHYRYVVYNTTTLEDMVLDRKRKDEDFKSSLKLQNNEYNINCYYNFTQVFGQNPFYWWVPVQEEKPLRGRGVYWDKNSTYSKSIKEQTKDSYN